MSTDSEQRHKRATERTPFDEEVRFVVREEVVGQGVDIGAGGIGVLAPRNLAVGQQVEIAILGGAATAFGTVRWAKPEDDRFRLGIQFREEDWAIMQLVDTLRAQEGLPARAPAFGQPPAPAGMGGTGEAPQPTAAGAPVSAGRRPGIR